MSICLFYFFIFLVIGWENILGASVRLSNVLRSGGHDRSLGITNGSRADIRHLPFMASMEYDKWMWGSGVVVGKRWILTTADNVFMRVTDSIVFRVGSDKWLAGGQVVRAEEAYVHPNYTGSVDNNIALVKTRGVIRYGRRVRPARLGVAGLPGGTGVVVAGWGSPDTAFSPSYFLLSTNLTVLGKKACSLVYPTKYPETLMCTKTSNTTGPSVGDYGDPVVANDTVYGLYIGGLGHDYPQLYTNVPAMYQWVKSYIHGEDAVDAL